MSIASNGSAGVGDRLRKVVAPAFAALPAPLRHTVLHAFGRYAPWEDGFDFTAPAPREGEVVGPPAFVGIGAEKSGTTWWYDLIAAHPEVATAATSTRSATSSGVMPPAPSGADAVAYHSWFPRPQSRITGEWTPDYLHQAWVPALLAKAAPNTACSSSCETPWSASAPASPTTAATPGGPPRTSTPTPWCGASTAAGSSTGSGTSLVTASSCCSTSAAPPTRWGSSNGPTPSSVSRRSLRLVYVVA